MIGHYDRDKGADRVCTAAITGESSEATCLDMGRYGSDLEDNGCKAPHSGLYQRPICGTMHVCVLSKDTAWRACFCSTAPISTCSASVSRAFMANKPWPALRPGCRLRRRIEATSWTA